MRLFPLIALMLLTGCAQRTLVIESTPPNAVVFINGKEEGRTPMKYDFKFYGDYDVILRHEGYQTLKTHRKLDAPIHEIPPIDLIGELFGAKDVRQWMFELSPEAPAAVDEVGLVARGEELRGDLRSSDRTRVPSTFPTTQAAQPTQPAP